MSTLIQKPASHAPKVVEFERLLDSDEAASLLKIHPKTLQRMAREGKIVGIQIGKLWRFRASDLDHWLKERLAS
ncbi:MAG TPA: helix-turn-helix domain-containing protein, partial [Candidatus Acidoferrales bacterium]|nr:helix-turn-helix domain-containing protein [Candidatus Acidoferrales bacterium]